MENPNKPADVSVTIVPWTAEDVPDDCIIQYHGAECRVLTKDVEGVVFISGAGVIKKMTYAQIAYFRYRKPETWEYCRK